MPKNSDPTEWGGEEELEGVELETMGHLVRTRYVEEEEAAFEAAEATSNRRDAFVEDESFLFDPVDPDGFEEEEDIVVLDEYDERLNPD